MSVMSHFLIIMQVETALKQSNATMGDTWSFHGLNVILGVRVAFAELRSTSLPVVADSLLRAMMNAVC